MKKILGIVVLGLLLSGNTYAKEKILHCVATNELPDRSIIFDDETETLSVNGQNVEVTEWSKTMIKWKGSFKLGKSLNRITGMTGDHECHETSGTKF